MAIWQFDLLIAPRITVMAHLAEGAEHLPPAIIDSGDLWLQHELPAGYERRLEAFLPWAPSWDPEWKIFGTEEGTRVDVLMENGKIQEVKSRIDARVLEPEVLERLVDFVSECDCVFVSLTGQVIEPDPFAVWVELELSPALQFVRDPQRFLDQLSRRKRDPA